MGQRSRFQKQSFLFVYFVLFLKLCLFQKERDLSLLLGPEDEGGGVSLQFNFPCTSHQGFPLSPQLQLNLTKGDNAMSHNSVKS